MKPLMMFALMRMLIIMLPPQSDEIIAKIVWQGAHFLRTYCSDFHHDFRDSLRRKKMQETYLQTETPWNHALDI